MNLATHIGTVILSGLFALSIMNTAADNPKPTAAEEVISRELAFAARARIINPKDAFMEFFASDAVMFAPEPVNALTRLKSSPPWKIILHWWPAEVAVSADGKLAYSTGPVQSRSEGQPIDAHQYGTYFSIWKKNRQGDWKVLADLGTDTPAIFAGPGDPVNIRVPKSGEISDTNETAAEAGRRFSIQAGQNLAAALESFAAPGYRLHLPDTMPVIGVRAALPLLHDSTSWICTGAVVAGSDDLGACWGKGQGGYLSGRYGFLRVWARNESGEWTILAEVFNGQTP